MKILVATWVDAASLAIENIVQEMIARGHQVEIYAFFMDHKNIRMFLDLGVIIHPIKELTEKIVQKFDIAFATESATRGLRFFNIYIFSYNHIPDTWVSDGSDFMFTMVRDRKLRQEEDCAIMPLGVAKNDTPKICEQPKKQILFIDAGHNPYGEKGKYEIAHMLLNICEKFPEYNLVIKPRWLPEELKNQTHRSNLHIYNVLKEITDNNFPDNLVMTKEHRNLQEMIDESVSVITTSISCYLDVALRGKGCIVVDGLDSEEAFDTRRAFENIYRDARDSGCCVPFQDVIKHLPMGIICDSSHLKKKIPYTTGVSGRIVDVMEYVYENYIRQGKYPTIRPYNYETYQTEMAISPGATLQELKYKRLKNGICIMTRLFEYTQAEIDYSSFFHELEEIYCDYATDMAGFRALDRRMVKMMNEIRVENRDKLMFDAIDQSILLQSLYDLGMENDILALSSQKILCIGPYHYYLGMIYAKQKYIDAAIEHFAFFLKEANSRSYNKYPQESDWGIRNAYNYIFQHYDGENMDAADFVKLCFDLEGRDITIIDYRNRKRAHSLLPKTAEKLQEGNPNLAYQCLQMYVEKEYHYVIRDLNETIKNLKTDISKIKSSIFYRIEQKIRWVFRKTKGGICCLQEHGVVYTLKYVKEKITDRLAKPLEKIRSHTIYRIWSAFHTKVMRGYEIYAEEADKYGGDIALLFTATSRGDAYILGSLLNGFLQNHPEIKKPVFVVWEQSTIDIAKLFEIPFVRALSTVDFRAVISLFMFDSTQMLNIYSLHLHAFYRHTGIFGFMMGLHNFNLFSLSAAVLGVDKNSATRPVFFCDEKKLQEIFNNIGAVPHRTVILAPYAKTIRPLPIAFWMKLVEQLHDMGLCVCTNAVGQEKALIGTLPISIPFAISVPVLERAGITIGLRSGFQDVTCTADCLKISLAWQTGATPFCCCSDQKAFSLSAMYGEPNQYDLPYSLEDNDQIIEEILQIISDYQKKKQTEIGNKEATWAVKE